MGCFSWVKADRTTKIANIREGKPFKLLIPKEFGGGFIKDHYRGYGIILDASGNKYDMYELLAIWNKDQFKLQLKGNIIPLKPVDEYTDFNRVKGIDVGCYIPQIDALKYPLKLVSVRYKGTYEECDGRSYNDPNQGGEATYWDELDEILDRVRRG